MKNITYLFGAGASRNALPIVSELPDRIDTIAEMIRKPDFILENEIFKSPLEGFIKVQEQSNLVASLKELAMTTRNHSSIDTLAKKLWLQGKEDELKKLKALISVYFICEQAISKVDKRYDAFFASILNKNVTQFPENIKILSWNYDFQFEKSYSAYSENSDLNFNQTYLNVVSKYSARWVNPNGFGIYKINGTTSIYNERGGELGHFINTLNSDFSKNFIHDVLFSYLTVLKSNSTRTSVSFAWEEPDPGQSIMQKILSVTPQTEVLVIIGYSFPFFNRQVDGKIIRSMPSLNKVYFQGPEPREMKERFLAIIDTIPEDKLVLRSNTEQFLLPNEL